jgi:hypothetical protein
MQRIWPKLEVKLWQCLSRSRWSFKIDHMDNLSGTWIIVLAMDLSAWYCCDILLTLGLTAAICVQWLVALMVGSAAPKAIWTVVEVFAMLKYLKDYFSERGNAVSFKKKTWTAGAGTIAVHQSVSPVKMGNMCKSKWKSAHNPLLSASSY